MICVSFAPQFSGRRGWSSFFQPHAFPVCQSSGFTGSGQDDDGTSGNDRKDPAENRRQRLAAGSAPVGKSGIPSAKRLSARRNLHEKSQHSNGRAAGRGRIETNAKIHVDAATQLSGQAAKSV
jgi:hypothetical protein